MVPRGLRVDEGAIMVLRGNEGSIMPRSVSLLDYRSMKFQSGYIIYDVNNFMYLYYFMCILFL